MDLLKKQVTHRVFGLGNIVDFSDSFVEIQFPKGNKKFVFPDAKDRNRSKEDKRQENDRDRERRNPECEGNGDATQRTANPYEK